MPSQQSMKPALLALFAGMGLWLAAGVVLDTREPWDNSTYWRAFYPGALLLAALFGYLFTDRPWRWALFIFGGQFVALIIRNGELGNLWPLGMFLFGLLSLPAMLLAYGASRLRGT